MDAKYGYTASYSSATQVGSRLSGKIGCLRAISEQMNKWKGTRTTANENKDENVEEGKETDLGQTGGLLLGKVIKRANRRFEQ